MSVFELFKKSKTATSMICNKMKKTGNYECELGFDYEICLLKNNGFKHKDTYNTKQVENFISELGAHDLKGNSIKRWVFMDNDKINVYSFGNSEEIHIVKEPEQ